MAWWWLSFADARRPRGSRNLGVSIVEADTLYGAIAVSHIRGCNPGGQVAICRVPAPLPGMGHRMLTADELKAHGISALPSAP